jgi:squalene-associated FAD-dependent desaturase
MLHLAREPISGDSEETIGRWLVRHGQTQQAIDRFWSVVLVSALSETVDRASLSAAQKVFRDGFLASRDAYELVLPRLPLAAIWQRAGQWLSDRGVKLHLGARVDQILGDRCRATEAVLRDGTRTAFDFVIVAVPWRHVGRLFDRPLLEAMPGLSAADQIEPAPITAVHLWFDRPITALPHAALIGRLSQWVFRVDGERGDLHHYAVVISASRGLSGRGHDEVVAEVRRDLAAIWPAAEGAELKHSRVLTNRAAVFSVLPGLDRLRPAQQTPVHNLFLAGDWTSTGWPATMEGAVRSGFLGVDAILKSLGHVGYPLRSS